MTTVSTEYENWNAKMRIHIETDEDITVNGLDEEMAQLWMLLNRLTENGYLSGWIQIELGDAYPTDETIN